MRHFKVTLIGLLMAIASYIQAAEPVKPKRARAELAAALVAQSAVASVFANPVFAKASSCADPGLPALSATADRSSGTAGSNNVSKATTKPFVAELGLQRHSHESVERADFAGASPCPTQVYTSQPELMQEVLVGNTGPWEPYADFIHKYKSLLQSILAQEECYAATHVPLYHGQNSQLTVVTDFLTVLHYIKIGEPLPADFMYLRYQPVGSTAKTVQEWIDSLPKKLERGQDKFNDWDPSVYTVLLPVNFSLWNNTTFGGESSFEYFVRNRSVQLEKDGSLLTTILTEIFKEERLDCTFIPSLIKLAKSGHAYQAGTLYQIFVPNDLIDDCVYLSKPWGVPSTQLYTQGKEVIAAADWDAAKDRYRTCSTILKLARRNPEQFMGKVEDSSSQRATLDALQGRLLLQQHLMLNPKSRVKISRYRSGERIAHYHEQLLSICSCIFQRDCPQEIFQEVDQPLQSVQTAPWIPQLLHELTLPIRIKDALEKSDTKGLVQVMKEKKHPFVFKDNVTVVLKALENKQVTPELIRCLVLECGENPNQKSRHDWTPLGTIAHRAGHYMYGPELIHCLVIECKADIDVVHGKPRGPAINRAIIVYPEILGSMKPRHFKAIQTLVECKANLEHVDQYRTPLQHAVREGHTSLVELLLQHKADVNTRNEQGLTALMHTNDYALIKLLLDNKADATLADNQGRTALFDHYNPAVVQLLLDHNADPHAKTKDTEGQAGGKTAADVARSEAVKTMLLQAMQQEHKYS